MGYVSDIGLLPTLRGDGFRCMDGSASWRPAGTPSTRATTPTAWAQPFRLSRDAADVLLPHIFGPVNLSELKMRTEETTAAWC
jgi:hypothetical protein